MTSTANINAFLIWPETRPMTLALAEEALRVAQRVHPEVSYELRFLQAEAPAAGAWQLPGEPWAGRLEGCHKLFVLADEPPAQVAPALAQALKQRRIAAAGLDVFEGEPAVHPELLQVPNVVLTPHIASATLPTRLAMANLAADNLIAFFEQGRALTPVHAPTLQK